MWSSCSARPRWAPCCRRSGAAASGSRSSGPACPRSRRCFTASPPPRASRSTPAAVVARRAGRLGELPRRRLGARPARHRLQRPDRRRRRPRPARHDRRRDPLRPRGSRRRRGRRRLPRRRRRAGRRRVRLRELVTDLLAHLRLIFLQQQLGQLPAEAAVTDDERARVASQAERLEPATVHRLIDLLRGVLDDVRDGADPRLPLELALVRTVPARRRPHGRGLRPAPVADRGRHAGRGAATTATAAGRPGAPPPTEQAPPRSQRPPRRHRPRQHRPRQPRRGSTRRSGARRRGRSACLEHRPPGRPLRARPSFRR